MLSWKRGTMVGAPRTAVAAVRRARRTSSASSPHFPKRTSIASLSFDAQLPVSARRRSFLQGERQAGWGKAAGGGAAYCGAALVVVMPLAHAEQLAAAAPAPTCEAHQPAGRSNLQGDPDLQVGYKRVDVLRVRGQDVHHGLLLAKLRRRAGRGDVRRRDRERARPAYCAQRWQCSGVRTAACCVRHLASMCTQQTSQCAQAGSRADSQSASQPASQPPAIFCACACLS
jgi:hypothetical protein